MARTNGKTEVEEQRLDTEHELPAADEKEQVTPSASEVDQLRAERDSLLDRLARMQADFENARKRAAKEQQEYRDYALVRDQDADPCVGQFSAGAADLARKI